MRTLALAAGALIALSSCMEGGGRAVEPLPPPPSTAPVPSTTIAPDFSDVALPAARGATTTTTMAIGPGEAAFKGTVTGPEGPVGGALVRVERLVGTAVASMEVTSLEDGSWEAKGIRGGAYRVRAWRPPDLALVEPAFIFVAAKQTFPLDLEVERYAGPFATAAIAPRPPVVGHPANLVVQLSQRSVDDRGFVVAVPMVGATAQLASPSGGWLVASPNPTLTDANGRARWDVRCRAAGTQALSVSVGGATAPLPLTLPACAEAPSTSPGPTSPGSPPTSSSPATVLPRPTTSTSTTRPASTTSTTRRPPTTTTRPR